MVFLWFFGFNSQQLAAHDGGEVLGLITMVFPGKTMGKRPEKPVQECGEKHGTHIHMENIQKSRNIYRNIMGTSWKTMGNNNYRWRFHMGTSSLMGFLGIWFDGLMIWSWNFVSGISRPPWLLGLPFPYYSHATPTLETPLFRSGRWWEWGFHQLGGPEPKFHGSNMVNILLAITILCMCNNQSVDANCLPFGQVKSLIRWSHHLSWSNSHFLQTPLGVKALGPLITHLIPMVNG